MRILTEKLLKPRIYSELQSTFDEICVFSENRQKSEGAALLFDIV